MNMRYRKFKALSGPLSLIFSVISLILILYIKAVHVFESASLAGFLVLMALASAFLAVGFAVVAFPRWQGFLAFAVACYVGYCVIFGPLYFIQ